MLMLAVASLATGVYASDWPVLHKDNQRSGYTSEMIKGPYERKWFRNFADEIIASRVEAIVAEKKVFIGTMAGNMYALNEANGETAWKFKSNGMIGASPCYDKGSLYFGTDKGYFYSLNTSDGKKKWSFKCGAGVWVHPLSDGKSIYFGDRSGTFYALNSKTGKKEWSYKTGDNMILAPASLSLNGKEIIFASEDMHAYCLDTNGKLLWKSKKMLGLSVRDYAPTIWKGLAIFRVNPAMNMHTAPGQVAEPSRSFFKKQNPPKSDVLWNKWGGYALKYTPERYKAELGCLEEFFKKNPQGRSLYAFDLKTGKKPWDSSVLLGGTGLYNVGSPCTFNPQTGDLYVWSSSNLSNFSQGVPTGRGALVKIDRKTGFPELINHKNRIRGEYGFAGTPFHQANDESQSLSLMGKYIVNTHQDVVNLMDLETLKFKPITGQATRDTYGSIYGPAVLKTGHGAGFYNKQNVVHEKGLLVAINNEWHGPGRGIVAIADDRMFWVSGSQVVCIGGPNVPKTASGGALTLKGAPKLMKRKVPVVPAGNLATASVGKLDKSIPVKEVSAKMVKQLIQNIPNEKVKKSVVGKKVEAKLDKAVTELISEKQWAPFIVELGISGEELHFTRSSETMQALAMAYPYLNKNTKKKTLIYLDALFDRGVPFGKASCDGVTAGKRREFHTFGELVLKSGKLARKVPKNKAIPEDLYALWAYANYCNRWDKVKSKIPQIKAAFSQFKPYKEVIFEKKWSHKKGKMVTIEVNIHDDWKNDSMEHLNKDIAGVIGYARIMKKLEQSAEVAKAEKTLKEMLTLRLHHEKADTRYIRGTASGTISSHHHAGKLPRYVGLTPELSSFLAKNAPIMKKMVPKICDQIPVWHHAFGERMIGGETYTNPPHLARGLFAIQADGIKIPMTDLIYYLDQPWCKADLYYIEKLTSLLRN